MHLERNQERCKSHSLGSWWCNTINTSVISHSIYRLKTVPVKISASYSVGIDLLTPNVCGETEDPEEPTKPEGGEGRRRAEGTWHQDLL